MVRQKLIYVRSWLPVKIGLLQNSKFPHFCPQNWPQSSISCTTVCKKTHQFSYNYLRKTPQFPFDRFFSNLCNSFVKSVLKYSVQFYQKKIYVFFAHSSTQNWTSEPIVEQKMSEFGIFKYTNWIRGSKSNIYQHLSDHWNVPLMYVGRAC